MTGTVVMVGALDTKAAEYAFVRDLLVAAGLGVVLIDIGVLGSSGVVADYSNNDVAAAGGTSLTALIDDHDRGRALAVMASGATNIVAGLLAEGRVDAALALGGTGGTAVASEAFRQIPLGIPKIIVSTAASGRTDGYIEQTDLVLMPSVTDIAGLNKLLRQILRNAANAIIGQVAGRQEAADDVDVDTRPMIAASMFGVTTQAVTEAQRLLDGQGMETVVFHMTGIGGRSLEHLVQQRWLAGVLDVTTTELADELVGGVFSAGPARLTAAAVGGIPQVVSVGALDMVNFGPMTTVPEAFADRNLYVHNSSVTLMRTTAEECAELGRRFAERVSQSTNSASVFLPLGGISALSVPGGPFYDPDADRALFEAVRRHLDRTRVDLVELDYDINHPAFAAAMAERLLGYIHATDGNADGV